MKILFWTTRCKYPGKTDFSSYLSLVSVYISAVSPGRAENLRNVNCSCHGSVVVGGGGSISSVW